MTYTQKYMYMNKASARRTESIQHIGSLTIGLFQDHQTSSWLLTWDPEETSETISRKNKRLFTTVKFRKMLLFFVKKEQKHNLNPQAINFKIYVHM